MIAQIGIGVVVVGEVDVSDGGRYGGGGMAFDDRVSLGLEDFKRGGAGGGCPLT